MMRPMWVAMLTAVVLVGAARAEKLEVGPGKKFDKVAAALKAAKDVKTVIRNNVCVGPLVLTNAAKFEEAGNLLFKTPAEAGWADPAKYDFSLKAGSPCIGAGMECGKVGEFSLKPTLQYVHPHSKQPRPDDGKLDVGAFKFKPANAAAK
ncbi:MAG: hypothetical protein PHU85_17840 [Phycisphaerae bacterium]|nr:hypothetical protein [Phycisphaerae bacterium]